MGSRGVRSSYLDLEQSGGWEGCCDWELVVRKVQLVPQWDWGKRKTSIRKAKISLSIFLCKSAAHWESSSPVLGLCSCIFHTQNVDIWRRCYHPPLTDHEWGVLASDVLRNPDHPLILSIPVLFDSRSFFFFFLNKYLVGINAYEIGWNKLVKYLYCNSFFEVFNIF